jgi:Family of unknown function (DUF5654)
MLSWIFKFIPTQEVLKEVLTLATAGFSLIAALAWNETIQAAVNQFLPVGNGSALLGKFIYAMVVTILAVFVTINLSKFKERFDEEKQQNPPQA